jgi:hypothetical protein
LLVSAYCEASGPTAFACRSRSGAICASARSSRSGSAAQLAGGEQSGDAGVVALLKGAAGFSLLKATIMLISSR